MTAVPLVGGRIIGTNAEKTAFVTTNLRAGWIWIESDTQNMFYWSGSAWVAVAGPSATITETNKTLTAPVFDSFLEANVIAAPADPASTKIRLYAKAVDANNDGLFVKLKIAGTVTEVWIV